MSRRWTPRRRSRIVFGLFAALAILVPLAMMWGASLVPETFSVMQMGYPVYGGGPRPAGVQGHADGHGLAAPAPLEATPVTELAGPRSGAPDAEFTLVARAEPITIDGTTIDGFTLDHESPGPELRVGQGELVQVSLVNESVADGATLHWHGVDVPNAEDGVAGVTQDAVPVGGSHTYRFVAEDAGTYWYHSHQVSHEQVRGGLFGVLVVEPDPGGVDDLDVVAAVHTYAELRTVNGTPGVRRVTVEPGRTIRVRVVNTDDGTLQVTAVGAPYRVLAVDGRDVVDPDEIDGRSLQLAAGGRADLAVTVPSDGAAVRVQLGADGGTALVLGPPDAEIPEASVITATVDLLSYGSPAPLGFDPDHADRRFDYDIGRRLGFVDGRPGLHWSINGHLYPDVPMFMVRAGDVVRMRLSNHSGTVHPMHLHGHHALVLSRNGVAASGSPWWVDSLDVASGDTYEIAFVADNPGIWMDHCHNLPHSADGLVAHLAYEGVAAPFQIGTPAGNEPE